MVSNDKQKEALTRLETQVETFTENNKVMALLLTTYDKRLRDLETEQARLDERVNTWRWIQLAISSVESFAAMIIGRMH